MQGDDELEVKVLETERLYKVFLFRLHERMSDLRAIQKAFREYALAKGHICAKLKHRIKRNTVFKNQLTEFPGFPIVQHIVANIREQLREQLPELQRIIETDKRTLNHLKSSYDEGEKQFDEYLRLGGNLRFF